MSDTAPKAPPMVTHGYGTQLTIQGPRLLELDFFDAGAGCDVLVFLHSGGFRTGSRSHRNHTRMAHGFARFGLSSAFIDYRLARPPALLRPEAAQLLPELIADAEAAGEPMTPSFYGARPLAAAEDACLALTWLDENRAALGHSGRYALGGSSAGAIASLVALYLARPLGYSRPPITSAVALSGGFPYPGHLPPPDAPEAKVPVLALCSPNDARTPDASLRRLKALLPESVTLLEHPDFEHGECHLPDEKQIKGLRRIAQHQRAARKRKRKHRA